MNGYDLSRQWFDFAFENTDLVSGNHAGVYLWAVELNNRLGWSPKFGLPSEVAMQAVGIKSYKTYSSIFEDLVSWGFFKIHQRSKNQYTANVIGLVIFTEAHTKALDKALPKQGEKQYQSTSTIIKPLNQETNKLINIEFVVFWDLYGNKKDREKSEAKWHKLTDQERVLAIEDIPKYVASLDDRKYQKNPLTYLNGKCWQDERGLIPLPGKNGTTTDTPRRRHYLNESELHEQSV